jgi:hypothetical protein
LPGLPVAGATANEWSPNGDLLLDGDRAAEPALDALLLALRSAPWRLLWFSTVPLGAPRWQAFCAALDRAGMRYDAHQQTPHGIIRMADDWETFQRSLSKQLRHKLKRCSRRLAEQGAKTVELLDHATPAELEARLRTAFAIEDVSWKGKAGSSVLRRPGLFDFFLRQAVQLAAWRQLELSLLCCGEQAVSFVYGHAAKGVSHWHKISYLPEFGACTPGQLLQWELLARYHDSPRRRAVDTFGPLTRAVTDWRPSANPMGRLLVATRGAIGPLALRAWQYGTAARQRWRARGESADSPSAAVEPTHLEPAAAGAE